MAEPTTFTLCCLCDGELFGRLEQQAGYCEDCREGSGDLEDLLDAALDKALPSLNRSTPPKPEGQP